MALAVAGTGAAGYSLEGKLIGPPIDLTVPHPECDAYLPWIDTIGEISIGIQAVRAPMDSCH
ncbi:hypothetical protein SAMN05216412_11510 [Nitrosospira multiformis]|uniref:Uncharacterized protein n=1 Tax=Nitrosospira multiformis TaxID=1231 RepID=A0A1I0GQ75_9PROT|nr:hypothetical protein [Nitrosospira multiformis]SET72542.1 hypothetical protein SAMN05216412_11510 [Nitrosospira multiformis]